MSSTKLNKTQKNRTIPQKKDKIIELLHRQNYKCANKPGSNLYNIGNYECLLWENKKYLVPVGAGWKKYSRRLYFFLQWSFWGRKILYRSCCRILSNSRS